MEEKQSLLTDNNIFYRENPRLHKKKHFRTNQQIQ